MKYLPINYDVAGKDVLVVGGGQVAYRKVQTLLACGAEVTVVSPAFCARLARLKKVSRVPRRYKASDMRGAHLVISATDCPEVNHRVWKQAERRGIPVNVVDQPELCTFTVPAMVHHGDLMITISTGGASPALSAELRKKMQQVIGPEYEKQIRLLKTLRPRITASGLPPAARSKLLKRLAGQKMRRLIKAKGQKAAQEEATCLLDAALKKQK